MARLRVRVRGAGIVGLACAEALTAEMLATARRQPDLATAVKAVRGVRRRELFRTSCGELLGEVDVDAVGAALSRLTDATLEATLDGARMRTTIVTQRPPPGPSATAPSGERVHVFAREGARRTTLTVPAPAWLRALSGDALGGAAKGALRAPMPSVVVQVRVEFGQRVEAGAPVVVLESMKTETVLRAPVAGVVRAVGCVKGEMVEEGRELVDVEEDVTASD